MRKPDFAYTKTKALINAFVFAPRIVQIPLLHTAKISGFKLSSVTVQAGLCRNPQRPVYSCHSSFLVSIL